MKTHTVVTVRPGPRNVFTSHHAWTPALAVLFDNIHAVKCQNTKALLAVWKWAEPKDARNGIDARTIVYKTRPRLVGGERLGIGGGGDTITKINGNKTIIYRSHSDATGTRLRF